MKTLAVLNEKGGVGKTTLATHIASGLAIKGARVLLVDFDPQGNVSLMFGFEKEPALFHLLSYPKKYKFSDVVSEIPKELYESERFVSEGNLYLLPSDNSVQAVPNMVTSIMVVRRAFEKLRNTIDYIIIDTSPTPSILHGMVYMAVDAILYPTILDVLSIDGLIESSARRIEASDNRVVAGMPEIQVAGIVPNLVERTIIHENIHETLKDEFGHLVLDSIPKRTVWQQTQVKGQALFRFAPDDVATREAWNLVLQVENALI